MTFNTTSYLAGVGSVVMVLSAGFAGGYLLATPTHVDPPNRLQRLAAEDHSEKAIATTAAKPEVVATAAPATPVAAPVTAAQPPAQQPPAQQTAAQPTVPAAETKTPEPARTVASTDASAPASVDKVDADKIAEKANTDKARAAEARLAERKRSEARRFAEQQRKQRELEVATVAVRRIIHGRDAPDIIRDRDEPIVVENDPPEAPPTPEMPHFNLFGQ
jgi:hypothetical protein